MLLFSFSKKENTVTYYFLGGAREYRWEGQRGGKVFSFLFSSIRFCWNNLRNMIQFELSFCTGIFFLKFFFFGGILLFHVVKSLIFLFCFVVFIKSCRNFTSKGYQFFSQFIYYYDYHINYLLTFKRDRLK